MNKSEYSGKYLAIFLLSINILFQATAIFFGKVAANQFINMIGLLSNPYYIASIICLVGQAIFWHLTLKKIDLSIAYPTTSFVFIFVFILSMFVFHETISFTNVVGLIIMIVGIIFLNK